ncbi:MAG: SusF/SusE family outer membrane protein [Bacteroides uniformis]|nr:SusF/SusE family outer membrane protein [Bacteroides uniformis]
MKTKYIYLLLAGIFALMSCEEDATPILELKTAAALHALSQTDITITKDNKDAQFPEIAWDKADYGVSAVVNYVVTLTNTSTNKSIVIGETGDAKLAFTNSEMNSLLAKVGAYPGQTYDFTVSLVSEAYDAYTDAASNSITFKATPYDPNVDNITWKYAYVAVGYPDWDYTTAYLIGDPDGDGIYSGYASFDGAASYAIIDGADLTKVLAKDQQVTADGKGFIEITLDAEGKVTQSEKGLVWGVIGDATSSGWDKDTQMEYDTTTRLWTVVTPLLDKEFKFRANNDWEFNYGAEEGKLSELAGNLVAGGQNFKVVKASPYIITLNLTNAGKYTYSMEETTIELSSSAMTLPGSYQSGDGWKPEADDCYKVESAARDFKYTGTHYFPADTEFKFYDSGTWIGVVGDITWNEAKTSTTFVIGDGGNVKIEAAGYYRVGADTKKMVATLDKTGWEIIGDATPGGWDKGILMDYDAETQKWSVTVTLGDGEMKFRWDAAWTINFGGSLGALTQDGGNIKVSAGTYTIVLDPEAKNATMTAN